MMGTFERLARELDRDSVVDLDGISRFQWTLENEYESRLSEALEYYGDREDLLYQECMSHIIELERLEERFIESEEYEKCSVIRDLGRTLTKSYAHYLSPSVPGLSK